MLCSNKDSWKNSPFCNTEEKWWHIWSHAEFMKTETFFYRGWKHIIWCPFPTINSSISQQVNFGNRRKQPERAAFLRTGLWVPSRCSHQKFLEASLFFYIVSACCELSLKYLLLTCGISPWCSFFMENLAHLFWGNLASESDSSWKL